jgi:polyketide cyclase/dehydrase/lipid transport protein
MAQQLPHLQITRFCKARPEAIYDLLADLRTHIEWGGARQSREFRLISLESPPGPATAGTSFSSTGRMPMSRRRWSDRSTVTVADRPQRFELTTQAMAGRDNPMTAVYTHRYEITPAAGGARVTYVMTQLSTTNPILRFGPAMSGMTWLMIPFYAGRGLRNLLALAEQSESRNVVVAGSPKFTQEV